MKVIIALLAVAITLAFCKTNKVKYTSGSLPAKQLRWGNGGGFAGKETANTLLENGQIFQSNGIDSLAAELPTTKAKTAAALFSTAQNLGLADINFDQPGNMYYFLEIKEGETAKRITWGDNKNPVEQKAKDFYTVLNQLLARE